MKPISLTQGQVAIVDDEDFDELSKFKWFAIWKTDTQSFYARRTITLYEKKRSAEYMHRRILGLSHGDRRHGDHRNHDTLDNRRCNLRIATRPQSVWNSRKRSDNSSGFKGVHRVKNWSKWRARITINGIRTHLGYFSTADQAHEAYRAVSENNHGEFSCCH
jgi:AP2 domain